MKKTNNFEKFLPKKKNSVIKEEIRQQKKKFKKERQDQMEHKKIAKREQTTLLTKINLPKVIKQQEQHLLSLVKRWNKCP